MEKKIIGAITFSCEQNQKSLMFWNNVNVYNLLPMGIIRLHWLTQQWGDWLHHCVIDPIWTILPVTSRSSSVGSSSLYFYLAMGITRLHWLTQQWGDWLHHRVIDPIWTILPVTSRSSSVGSHYLSYKIKPPWSPFGFIDWPSSEETDCITASSIPYGRYPQWPADPHLLSLN